MSSAIRAVEQPEWWKRHAIYQIYPLSFQDSDGDGIGDLAGLATRVDYLAWLGVHAVWLSPVYRSPMLDFGYDISDYTDIDPVFGSLDQFDQLLEALHRRDIRLILDVVPNHTSDRHAWFRESRSSRHNPKRDWYVWSDPRPDGGPPNNWLSRFGGSAWEWDPQTGQYYYHAFLREQPDLNWHNPQVRAAFADVLRFWLKRGVDGFRIDASAVLAEDPLLRDDPPNPEFDDKMPPPEKFRRVFTDARPETMRYLEEMRAVVDEFPDRVVLGEVQGGTGRIGQFYAGERPRFHLPLNFLLLDTQWDAASLSGGIDQYLNAVPEGAWPVWILGSHDKPRIASLVGEDRVRLAAMLLFTLPGTPILFAGDEIGTPNLDMSGREPRDPFEKRVPGYGLNRDKSRSPMRWNAEPGAGFTQGIPWLPVGDGLDEHNVAKQRDDEHSLLSLYRRLIALRQSDPALLEGSYEPMRCQDEVLMFRRCHKARQLFVALNLAGEEREVRQEISGTILVSTHLDRCEAIVAGFHLRPGEGIVLAVAEQGQ
ncbi:alpha-glucosidase [Chelatococcus caeni]|uniref:Alpha-glucosidase n=1 Tax=Chelatococcus caeni TaxID=1348468 RepID=A0A840BXX5_9HYPH|nr:alpha-amylase family glycosyl hydrolase [Chelatococcus caeni]MBB4018361.1 alpha-glucosidase [Chelatococcus caeni]